MTVCDGDEEACSSLSSRHFEAPAAAESEGCLWEASRREATASCPSRFSEVTAQLADDARFFEITRPGSPGRGPEPLSPCRPRVSLERRSSLALEAAEQAFWPLLFGSPGSPSPRKRPQADGPTPISLDGKYTSSSTGSTCAFEIYSELCSDDGDISVMSDWTVDDLGSPRRKNSPRKKSVSPRKKRRGELPNWNVQDIMFDQQDFQEMQENEQLKLPAVSESEDPEAPQEIRYASDGLPYSYDDFVTFYGEQNCYDQWTNAMPQDHGHIEPEGCKSLDTSFISNAMDQEDHMEHRKLCTLVWESRPMWRPKDFVSAERRLKKVGIETLEDLAASLRPKELLNEQLQQCGEQPFWKATIKEFKRRVLGIVDDYTVSEGKYSSEARSKERLLWDMLWAARPLWLPVDLAAADRKLTMIGIYSIPALQELLASGGVNEKLKDNGAKTFTGDTVRALKAYVPHAHQLLRMFLQEARPLWTSQEVAAAERKLENVGVASVITMSEILGGEREDFTRGYALNEDGEHLNRRLQEKGFKGFTIETIDAFHRQLEIMYRAIGSAGGG